MESFGQGLILPGISAWLPADDRLEAVGRLARTRLVGVTRAIAEILSVAMVVGCETPGPPPMPSRAPIPPDQVRLPDHPPCVSPDPGIACVEVGVAMFGTLLEKDGCVWMIRDNGEEVRIVWPFGYSATFEPFVVFDNAGAEVARDGDYVRAEGAGPSQGDADACGRTLYVVLAPPVVRGGPG